jgi:hypothetical protein
MAVLDSRGFQRAIHDISNAQFRSKFEDNTDTLLEADPK